MTTTHTPSPAPREAYYVEETAKVELALQIQKRTTLHLQRAEKNLHQWNILKLQLKQLEVHQRQSVTEYQYRRVEMTSSFDTEQRTEYRATVQLLKAKIARLESATKRELKVSRYHIRNLLFVILWCFIFSHLYSHRIARPNSSTQKKASGILLETNQNHIDNYNYP